MHGTVGHSKFTQSILDIVNMIDGKSPLQDSLFEEASAFFECHDKDQKNLAALESKTLELTKAAGSPNKKTASQAKDALQKARVKYKKEKDRQEQERLKRLNTVYEVSEKIIRLSEGENWEKTQTASARMLGTLHLLCPTEGFNALQTKQRFKPAYKAILAMRLLDKLIDNGQIDSNYITARYDANARYTDARTELTSFQIDVLVPLITAAMFQDIGLLHPQAQEILKGKDGKRDQYAVLDKETRIELLKLNYKYTIEYIKYGLGTPVYVGNSKPERAQFVEKEEQKLKLCLDLLVGAQKPKNGIGNLIKIPQIYASFIFSAKPDQTLFDLPKAGLLITKAAKQSSLSELAVDSLLKILGHFPQGYGVAYITENADGSQSDSFEYAIVVELNPKNIYEPVCRIASKNLTFVGNGTTMAMPAKRNLYYPEPRKQLEKIDPERLKLILKKLVSNYEERKDLELIPSHWDPHTFFQYEKLQNLWKSA